MKLPYFIQAGWINTWSGEYLVNRVVDVASLSYRTEYGGPHFYVQVFNVGFWIGVVSKVEWQARQDRAFKRVMEMLNDHKATPPSDAGTTGGGE